MTNSMDSGFCFKSGGRCTETLYYKPKQVFAAFPFEAPYFSWFDEVVKPVVEGLKNKHGRYNLKLVDARAQTRTRDFMCSIVEGIRSSRFFIADLSLLKPNVYLELGIALGLGTTARRPFVLISNFQDHLSADISSVNVVSYCLDEVVDFQERLEATCLDTFRAAAPLPPTTSPILELSPYEPSTPMPQPPKGGGLVLSPEFDRYLPEWQK